MCFVKKISRCFIWCASRPSVRLGSNHWISKAILTVITVFAWLIIKSMPNRSESQPGGKKIHFSAITVLSSVQTEIADGRAPIWSQTLCNLEAIWPHFQISNVKRWKKRWGNGCFSIQIQTERDVQQMQQIILRWIQSNPWTISDLNSNSIISSW